MTQPWTDEDARILRAKHYADLRAPADSPMHQRGVVYGKALDHIEALEARVAELEAAIACPRHMLDEDAKDAARRAVAERIAKEGK